MVEARQPIKTPLRPETVSFASQSFHTLTREAAFLHPPSNKSDIPALDELVAPHIESFNAILEDSAGGGKGLLALAVDDIGAKVVFDSKKPGQGNRLSSELTFFILLQAARAHKALYACLQSVYRMSRLVDLSFPTRTRPRRSDECSRPR